MKKRNLIILILTAAILFLSFSACAPSSQTSEPQGDTFRFEDFAGSEVSDIQKVDSTGSIIVTFPEYISGWIELRDLDLEAGHKVTIHNLTEDEVRKQEQALEDDSGQNTGVLQQMGEVLDTISENTPPKE